MKETMSALDIKFCLEELDEKILNSWTGKIYEINGIFLFRFNPPEGDRRELIIEPGKRIHLTEMNYKTPQRPPSYPMLLRKHLSNARLVNLKQPDFERIVELEFENKKSRKTLVAELFGEGNILLCKEDGEIIQPYRSKTWKHRELKQGEKYQYPPKKGKNITQISINDLESILSESQELVRGLAGNLNIGGKIAEEICAKSDIEKDLDTSKLTKSDHKKIHSVIDNLISKEKSPRIILGPDGQFIDVLPFQFKTIQNRNFEKFDQFNTALDRYFQKVSVEKTEKSNESELEQEIEEVKTRLNNQKSHIETLKEKARKSKEKADAISTHHEKVDEAINNLMSIQKSQGWEKAKEEINTDSGSNESWKELIASVHPKEKKVRINLPEIIVDIDFTKSSFENASDFYEKSKKSKEKIKGARKAIKETEKELKKLREKGLETSEETVVERARKKKWYEKYRWFYSSDNFLVIAGRDAKTNQEIVERHMELNDLYLHADIKGAPHAVIKDGDGDIPESSIEEAAKFAAIHSKAWSSGLGNVDVYWVNPDQVTKEAPAGEYIEKGGYMIKGDRNYLTVPVEAAVGILDRRDEKIPMCGPASAIESHSNICINIKPGDVKKSDLAHKIQKNIEKETEADIDYLMQILPPGSGMIT